VICIAPKTSIETGDKNQKDKKKKKRWLSPSSINAYLRCPRNYFYGKIVKLKQKPSIHLIRGIAVHNAIGQFYKHKLNRCANLEYSDLRKMVLDLFKDEWESQEKTFPSLNLTEDELTFYYTDSQKMMLNFLHDFVKAGGFEEPDPTIEKMLFSKKYMLLGRIDEDNRARDPPLVKDWKTSKSKEITPEIKIQMLLYALLYKENFGRIPDLAVQFLKFKDGLEKFTISEDDLDHIAELVLDIHEKTQSENIEDYPCKCGWCNKNFNTKSEASACT